MKFLSKKTKIDIEPYISDLKRSTSDEKFLKFFEEKNNATPKASACILIGGNSLIFDYFLGRSKELEKDYLLIKDEYEGRIPKNFSAVCRVDEVHFICLGPKSKFYLWDRYKNDLYFDPLLANKYKKQDEKLELIAENFDELIGLIVDNDSDAEDDEYDHYEDPSVPFNDEDILGDFKNPELFFKQTPEAIQVQLKKLQLSKKGMELLALFAEKKLI
ncbi:hypothetical protein E8K88_14840 [Lampropedia aestuarii]|uniref:SMI1/KNR4 family protein n=1 Tax=Lampropedia aestuarii TaxID=2562762 RepID=A0A4S5BPP8_9BURK|nr:hypothetical protein [Lampropedia aestuarii]THJ31586.1 hypothetical protein E8K88_14840 [Lampropedia aestuarii]